MQNNYHLLYFKQTIEIVAKLKALAVAQFRVLFAANLCRLGTRLDVVADMAQGLPFGGSAGPRCL